MLVWSWYQIDLRQFIYILGKLPNPGCLLADTG